MKYNVAILFLVLVAFLAIWSIRNVRDSNEDNLLNGQRALNEREFVKAQQLLQRELAQNPNSDEALLLLGEVYLRQKQWGEAIQTFRQIKPTQPAYTLAVYTIGEIHREQLALSKAEAAYLECMESDRQFVNAHQRLALIKRLTGRPQAAEKHLRVLISQTQISTQELAWLAAPQRLVEASDFLRASHAAHPEDPLPLFGLGYIELNHGQISAAEAHLRNGLSLSYDPEAMASLGKCLITQNSRESLQNWVDTVKESSRNHPEIQYVHGLIAEAWNESKIATQSYVSCLQTIPNHKEALSHLASQMNNQQKDEKQAIMDLIDLLSRLEAIVSSLDLRSHPPAEASRQTANILQQLGRLEEAKAWAGLTTQRVDQIEIATAVNQVQQLINNYSTGSIDWLLAHKAQTSTPVQVPHSGSDFSFRNDHQLLGVDFRYYESPDSTREGRRMFEFTGGGVGVIDFDVDGFPDLYFTQGAEWPPSPGQRSYLDALYRNLGTTFHRVEVSADVVEPNFSQGLAIGDLNNDGFDDLYIANFGQNQLFINNGDGTFSNETETIPSAAQWTTSCAIADLNADSSPDIYEVNYLTGVGLTSMRCPTPAGARVCSPLVFKPAADRLLRSSGHSTFVDATQQYGLQKTGNGLGIVVGNLDADAELELFVANDLMKNFFWDQLGQGKKQFQDVALINGWALGSEGESQACMGIAVGDFNGDTTTDLFVTNYFNESNALYLVEHSGYVSDQSSQYGLTGPSLPMLGFGTQAIDADLDGDLDLFVVNGDLDDFSHEKRSLNMPAQLFENVDNKRFIEFKATRDDDYLSGQYRGRGLAKIDHNRDGSWDLAVSHLDSPSAVVTNLTDQQAHPLRLKLVGTASSRNAIGATVSITYKDASQNKTVCRLGLTAGDGYQASNEKLLIFSTERDRPVQIEIQWPSGAVDKWSDIQVHEGILNFLAIENQGLYPQIK